MIWPVQDHNGGIHLYTVCPYKSRKRLNFHANCRQISSDVLLFLAERKAGAEVERQFEAQLRANENSNGEVVRNLKG